MELEDEARAFGEGRVDIEIAIHVECHLFADRQSEAVASSQVANLEEGLEEVVALLLRDAGTSIGNKELVAVLSALLVFEGNLSFGRSILCSIGQQVGKNVGHVSAVQGNIHFRGIHCKHDIRFHFIADLVHQLLAELLHLDVLEFNGLCGVLQFGECLDMLGEVEQGLNLGLSAVKLAEGGFELCGNVADELRLQGVALVGPKALNTASSLCASESVTASS